MAEHNLEGKVAIITGSARNMGRALAAALAARGADIVVHHHGSSSEAEAKETVGLVEEQGQRAIVIEGDLAKTASIKTLFEQALSTFGHIDIVINNAGLVIKKPFVEVTEEDFDRSFGINAKAAYFVMQEAARSISDNGRIINIGTTILGATIPNYSVYAGSKAPLEDFTRALAKEIGSKGVTVNTIAPGPLDTSFYWGQETEQSAEIASRMSIANRLGNIEDIIPMIEFLTSAEARWVTAQTLFVNGGFTSR